MQFDLIHFIYYALKEPDQIGAFSFSVAPATVWPFDAASVLEALIFVRLVFCESAVAFCALGSVAIPPGANVGKLHVSRFSAGEIALIGLSSQAAEQFEKQMEDETGIRLIFRLGLIADPPQSLHQ
jgi:hypothetical protein